jgi:hypothetical protein
VGRENEDEHREGSGYRRSVESGELQGFEWSATSVDWGGWRLGIDTERGVVTEKV